MVTNVVMKVNVKLNVVVAATLKRRGSRVAQWKRAGPITQRSVDRNHVLLFFFKCNSC